jgi:ribosomal protein L24
MICNESGEPTRVGFTIQDNKKVRISKKTKNLIS